MTRGLHPLITDAIGGHGDRKKDVQSVYLTIGDADLVREMGPLGALKFRYIRTGKLCLSRLPRDLRRLSGGSDETRTRDLRRDRRKVHIMILRSCVISQPIQVHLDA